MGFFLNYSGTNFCPLKIKITQFPDGFRLNSSLHYWFTSVSVVTSPHSYLFSFATVQIPVTKVWHRTYPISDAPLCTSARRSVAPSLRYRNYSTKITVLVREQKFYPIWFRACARAIRIECFHMTSRRPYWCSKTMKRRPCWCPKPILWELNSFLMQTLSFVPINLHRCWPREWKHSIMWTLPQSACFFYC